MKKKTWGKKWRNKRRKAKQKRKKFIKKEGNEGIREKNHIETVGDLGEG